MSLEIYDSRGEALYPKTAEDDPNMGQYFDQHVLTFGKIDSKFLIESYFKVKTAVQKEQVSLRYTASGDEPLQQCRAAIRKELVEKNGWSVREPFKNKPGSLPYEVLWDSDSTTKEYGPGELFTDNDGLGLGEEDKVVLEELALESDHTVRVTADSYETIAKVVPIFAGTDYTVVVSRQNHAPPEHADIQFVVTEDQWNHFDLHPETESKLIEVREQQRVQRQKQKLEELSSILLQLSEMDTNKQTVQTKIDSGLSQTYPDLTIVGSNELQRLKRESKQTATTTSGTGRLSKKRVFITLGGVLLITLLTILVFLFGASIEVGSMMMFWHGSAPQWDVWGV